MTTEANKLNPELFRKKRIIQVTWLTQSATILAALFPLMYKDWFNLTLLFIFLICLSIGRYLVKKDLVQYGSNLVNLSITILILTLCVFNQGIRDEALLVFPALISFAVLTGTDKFLWTIYALIACSVMLMGLVNELELYKHIVIGTGIESAIMIVIILSVVTYSIKLLGSDLTSANKKLLEYQNELEQRVVNRTQQLQESINSLTEAKTELVEAEKMVSLGRLVAGVAHEINTPLGIAITASSLIQDSTIELKSTLDKNTVTKSGLSTYVQEIEQSIDMVQGNLKRAATLIADFKQAAVIQSDERVKTFNLFEILQTIVAHNKTLHKKVTADIFGDKAIFITHDPDAITRIFTNLYSNSCIHGFAGMEEGHIDIEIAQAGEQVSIIYSDNGKGIKADNVEHIFEPFLTTKRGKGGTGLGMHIVYNLVTQSLKGQIQYNPNYCAGACFEITFKLA
ncbi:HAMP domain-containing sensor histidine kinase [Thalassotalea sp. SU-HH00458]|uniref:sensor histidine kinase n=1 Tax=Thalassotalea sp. SU-HH00458 TaxID=3127657 RepID=UPI003103E597